MRLLVIEDYAPLAASLAQGLRETGYAVDVTGDGKEPVDVFDMRIDDVVFAQGYANGEAPCVARWSALAAGLPIDGSPKGTRSRS